MAGWDSLPQELHEQIWQECVAPSAIQDHTRDLESSSYTHVTEYSELSRLMNVALVSRKWLKAMIFRMNRLVEFAKESYKVSISVHLALTGMLFYLKRWNAVCNEENVPDFEEWRNDEVPRYPDGKFLRTLRQYREAQTWVRERARRQEQAGQHDISDWVQSALIIEA